MTKSFVLFTLLSPFLKCTNLKSYGRMCLIVSKKFKQVKPEKGSEYSGKAERGASEFWENKRRVHKGSREHGGKRERRSRAPGIGNKEKGAGKRAGRGCESIHTEREGPCFSLENLCVLCISVRSVAPFCASIAAHDQNLLRPLYPSSSFFRNCPVYESSTCATSSGVPSAMINPPSSPPSGPRSTI